MIQEIQDKIRFQVNKFIFDNGYAPTTGDLSEIMNIDENEVKTGLTKLAENHAIVLHPGTFGIWVAHPFSLAPTLFWVESGGRKWWGNCTWCSLGIAALTKADTRIFTKMSGEKDPLQIDIVGGKIVQKELLVHFPVPAKKFWDNVVYTCSVMLTFQNEVQVDDWCKRHRINKGEVYSIEKIWELARLWYGNYLDPAWTRKTPEYAASLFKQTGLVSDFWKLE